MLFINSKISLYTRFWIKIFTLTWLFFIGVKIVFNYYSIFILLYMPVITFFSNFYIVISASKEINNEKCDAKIYIKSHYPDIYNKIYKKESDVFYKGGKVLVKNIEKYRKFIQGDYDDGTDVILGKIKSNDKVIFNYMIWSWLLVAISIVLYIFERIRTVG